LHPTLADRLQLFRSASVFAISQLRSQTGPAMTTSQITGGATKSFERRTDPGTGAQYLAVFRRGAALKDDPILNKGTCFTLEERDELGLRGILPPAVSTPGEQDARAYENFQRAGDDVAKYLFLAALKDRNETLFHRLVRDHLDEMVPLIYTPTVGKVCERYSHIYRRPRGVYISTTDRGHVAEALRNAAQEDIRIIVVTDNEAILGIGDQGVGGMGIAIGKVSLYTVGAGIHPVHALPLDFDVGTDNAALLRDPLYLGARHPRLRGADYFSLLDELVDAIARVFPGALVQWEDFANQRAFEVLGRYRHTIPSFDDDIQGTGAIVEAGIRSAVERAGRGLRDERIVVFGAGASGAGIARQLRNALRAAGVEEADLSRRVLCLDSQGLILADRARLDGHKREIAASPAAVAGWSPHVPGRFGLLDVVSNLAPTVLIGASGQPGTFTEDVVKAMHRGCERPIILPLSNPTMKAEGTPEDILRWTNGAAIVATGSPFAPVRVRDVTHHIGQCNNVFVFPGVGLGAAAVAAAWLPDAAFAAAARAVHELTERAASAGAPIFPPLSRLCDVSYAVAVAVGQALVDVGAAPFIPSHDIERRVAAMRWDPVYVPYRAARPAAEPLVPSG
jgi:malate dehydrogenase (oxaloacetate-decarboxylating)